MRGWSLGIGTVPVMATHSFLATWVAGKASIRLLVKAFFPVRCSVPKGC